MGYVPPVKDAQQSIEQEIVNKEEPAKRKRKTKEETPSAQAETVIAEQPASEPVVEQVSEPAGDPLAAEQVLETPADPAV